jgi:DNA invertase Pin-like site-specific DNA recombinase
MILKTKLYPPQARAELVPRPRLIALLNRGAANRKLNTGDNVIVSELSRLGRSMLECMEILSIASQKQINIYAMKGNWLLDQSIQSKILAMAFAMAAEIEEDLISQRTK